MVFVDIPTTTERISKGCRSICPTDEKALSPTSFIPSSHFSGRKSGSLLVNRYSAFPQNIGMAWQKMAVGKLL